MNGSASFNCLACGYSWGSVWETAKDCACPNCESERIEEQTESSESREGEQARALETEQARAAAAQALINGDDDEPHGVTNSYTCYRCGHEWDDEWDCEVDDDCPECGARHCTPHTSTPIDNE